MAHKRNGKIATLKDDWSTPDNIFVPLNETYEFELDAAANAQNAKVPWYFDKEMDALSRPWANKDGHRTNTFLNPPYSSGNIDRFVERANSEGRLRDPGCSVVTLVPAACDTWWWHRWVLGRLPDNKFSGYCASGIHFIRGRVKFIGYDVDGKAVNNSPTFSSVIVVFKRDDETYWEVPVIGTVIVPPKRVKVKA